MWLKRASYHGISETIELSEHRAFHYHTSFISYLLNYDIEKDVQHKSLKSGESRIC